MQFDYSETLYNFDIFPKVLVAGKEAELHIINLGTRSEFEAGKEYIISVCALTGGNPAQYPLSGDFQFLTAVCDEKGGFTFKHTFESEQQYFVRVHNGSKEKRDVKLQLSVYCVDGDLVGRYPFIGDMHMHTYCSDGRQSPEVVAATYRSHGYDFLAITDHHRYYPSLRAIKFFKDVPTEFNLVPGEEVHLPDANGCSPSVHIVNFGGEYSVNALVEDVQTEEVGKGLDTRSFTGSAPDVMTMPEYEAKMAELAKEVKDCPENINPMHIAINKFAFDQIRKANGLAIFPHPTWLANVFHVPDVINDYFVEHKLFDAFEVCGGERYYEHNGFQIVRYYEDKARGFKYPIVGSTDSHCCYKYNAGALICKTIVFAKENERKEIISSVKDFFSVAVDTISEEYRIVGDMRLVRYSNFLLKNYFPKHDDLCYEEGRLMRDVAIGTEEEKADALKALAAINGRVEKLRKRYFDFD